MIHFLFSLTIYIFHIYRNDDSYFEPFPYLKYGFNNGDFDILFSQVYSDFVFGLATKEEIKRMDEIKYQQRYCNGFYDLSNIQYTITKNMRIKGKISSKSVLTPYIFSCKESYSLYIDFNFNNGKNHLDYRLQNFMKFVNIYQYFSLIGTLFFIFYTIYLYIKNQLYKTQNCKMLYDFFIFFSLFNALFAMFCSQAFNITDFYELHSDEEYFNEDLSKKFDFPTIVDLPVNYFITNMLVLMIIGIFYVLIFDCNSNCKAFAVMLVSSILLAIHVTFQMMGSHIIIEIINVISFFLLSLMIIFAKPRCSMIKISTLIYLLGYFIVFPIGRIIVFYTQYKESTHYVCMILSIIFVIFHFLSFVCFLIALVYFKEIKIEDTSISYFEIQIRFTISFIKANETNLNSSQLILNSDQNQLTNEQINESNANISSNQNFDKSENSESNSQIIAYTNTY